MGVGWGHFPFFVLCFSLVPISNSSSSLPTITQQHLQLGLPPRFAGVSLLALGNGAADVSATVSAITSDPKIGYKLSLGALTGAAMLISGGTCVEKRLVFLKISLVVVGVLCYWLVSPTRWFFTMRQQQPCKTL
jgi:Sodium/calcium exchanger protein